MPHRWVRLIVAIGIGWTCEIASADVSFDWVTVGNPGNAPDPLNSPGGPCETQNACIPDIGKVDYVYRIARYEVTNAQYVAFLNAVGADDPNHIYSPSMGFDPRGGITRDGSAPNYAYTCRPNMDNKPVNFVSFFDAMRFVNWLHNGQPTGAQSLATTEDGAYLIANGLIETRSFDSRVFLPNGNEWYKAAYHQPFASGGDLDDYWLYPTASNAPPASATADSAGDVANPGANVANFEQGAVWNNQPGNVTSVGSAGAESRSYYGTADQGGNLWEWVEETRNIQGSWRTHRGGAILEDVLALQSRVEGQNNPTIEDYVLGFRVASRAFPNGVPTASTWGLSILGLFLLLGATLLMRGRTLSGNQVVS